MLKFKTSLTILLLVMVLFPISISHGQVNTKNPNYPGTQIVIDNEPFSRISNFFGEDVIKVDGKIRNLTNESLRISYLIADNHVTWLGNPIKILSSDHPYAANEDAFFKTYFVWTDDNSFEIGPYEEIRYTIEFESPKRGLDLHTVVRTQDDKWEYSGGEFVEISSWRSNEMRFFILGFLGMMIFAPNVIIGSSTLGIYYIISKIRSSDNNPAFTGRSNFWYLLPIVFAIMGGLIAHRNLQYDNPKKAKICFRLGVITTVSLMPVGLIVILVSSII